MSVLPGRDRPFKDPRVWNAFASERARRRAVEEASILRVLADTMRGMGEHEGARLLEAEANDAAAFANECMTATAIWTGELQREAKKA